MRPMKPMSEMKPMSPMELPERWWPEELGDHPSSAGSDNDTRYAFFAGKQRLAVGSGTDNVQVFDTGDHRISGVQQGQNGQTATFTSQHGEVDLDELKTA